MKRYKGKAQTKRTIGVGKTCTRQTAVKRQSVKYEYARTFKGRGRRVWPV